MKRGTHGFTVEIFRLREKAVPVDVLEVAPRVVGLAFEPGATACRFSVVLESPVAAGRYTIAFYSFGDKGITHLYSLDDKMYNGAAAVRVWTGSVRCVLACKRVHGADAAAARQLVVL